MSALEQIADNVRKVIDQTDDEHPTDLFALAVIERQLREHAHMIAEGLCE